MTSSATRRFFPTERNAQAHRPRKASQWTSLAELGVSSLACFQVGCLNQPTQASVTQSFLFPARPAVLSSRVVVRQLPRLDGGIAHPPCTELVYDRKQHPIVSITSDHHAAQRLSS
ncbi:hypothetical protein V2G26_001882 [Clonostachys chloroleuca]